jgi:hypothetical protein
LIAPLLLLLQAAVAPPQSSSPAGAANVYNGVAKQIEVRIPSLTDAPVIDGQLDETVWPRAALLTGFSLYSPVDQRPAPDSTEVLVWYSPDAIYFGIRAFEPHGGVRATLSDRDRVTNDDNIELHLDTFLERRRAFVFIVNPLGVQADGIKNEGAGSFNPGQNIAPGQNDLNPDFTWASKGRLTEWGYEVEVRIPFKSLRYPALAQENWGLQVVRNVQHSGYQQTWTPARKASASFIVQEGTLVGMTGMRHGQVIELNPELTTSVNGAPNPTPGGEWRYTSSPALGGNVKWGVTSNFVVNGTVKPDFSQVEADALQIAGDARFAVLYPEKRPFFVDGSEQFTVTTNLIYTRRIVHPTAAAKVSGKIGRTDVALLSAIDDPQTSIDGDNNPAWNILRMRRDFGEQSFAGMVASSKEDGPSFNRFVEADMRHVFRRLYYLEMQGVQSATRGGTATGTTRWGPMWQVATDRTGRNYGFHYQIQGVHPDFVAASGFIPRVDFVKLGIANRYTMYGAPGSLIEQSRSFFSINGLWGYRDFFDRKSMLEDQVSIDNQLTLRRGWRVGLTPSRSSYAFDAAAYAGLLVQSGPGQTPTSFRPSDRITTFTFATRITTPQFQRFTGNVGATVGNDVDFFETSRVRRLDFNADLDWRPTERVRVNASYRSSRFTRRADDVVIATTRIPRVKLEYQLTRAVFVRIVGQYQALDGEPLVDPRSGFPIVRATGATFVQPSHPRGNDLRADWLFSYRPTPGTVFFAGYGSSLTETEPLRFEGLHKRNDAFFVKASYLIRR